MNDNLFRGNDNVFRGNDNVFRGYLVFMIDCVYL